MMDSGVAWSAELDHERGLNTYERGRGRAGDEMEDDGDAGEI